MWERTDNQEVGLEAAILQRKRNSSLVKRTRAENVTGLKFSTEAADSLRRVVGERHHADTRQTGTTVTGRDE